LRHRLFLLFDNNFLDFLKILEYNLFINKKMKRRAYMREIAGVIAIIMVTILLILSEEFRDLIKVGALLFIAHLVFEIYKVIK
jgi:hypothetical protein